MAEELAPRDAEQEAGKRRGLEARAALGAREERALREIVGVAGHLVDEEAIDAREVALEQKVLALTCKDSNGFAPPYLSELFRAY